MDDENSIGFCAICGVNGSGYHYSVYGKASANYNIDPFNYAVWIKLKIMDKSTMKYYEIWNIKEFLNLIRFMDIWNCWNMIRNEK